MTTSPMDKLKNAFVEALGVEPTSAFESLAYAVTPQWDSKAHMSLVASIEAAFDIMLSTDELISMNSFKKAQEIVQGHGVAL